jgi:RHS repeat-associated protein
VASIGAVETPYARFTYLGADMITEVDHPAVTGGLKLSYGADGAAGLNGLGRVVDQKWTTGDGETPAVVDRFGYTYDLAGNRLTRDVGAAPFEQDLLDEKYTYDALNRLTNVERGRLYCGDITASTLSQGWTLDAVGNWDEFAWDPDGAGSAGVITQEREHDAANQITGFIVGPTWVTPQYDRAGNMTLAPKPGDEYHGLNLTYDAWNRLVRVASGATPVAEYQYDGLNRRIAKLVFDAPSDTWTRTDSYFNEDWQVLEERVATAVLAADKGHVATAASVQYLWDTRYIDTPICRWRDANVEDPDLEETVYYTTDANHNVTAVIQQVDDDEDPETPDVPQVAERYVYDAYGTVMVLNPDWSTKAQNVWGFDNNRLYSGAPLDRETGLILMRQRYYDPSLGVFTSKDPLGLAGGNANLYGYASSNPVGLTDPTGLRPGAETAAPSLYLSYPAAHGSGATDLLGVDIFNFDRTLYLPDYDSGTGGFLGDDPSGISFGAPNLQRRGPGRSSWQGLLSGVGERAVGIGVGLVKLNPIWQVATLSIAAYEDTTAILNGKPLLEVGQAWFDAHGFRAIYNASLRRGSCCSFVAGLDVAAYTLADIAGLVSLTEAAIGKDWKTGLKLDDWECGRCVGSGAVSFAFYYGTVVVGAEVALGKAQTLRSVGGTWSEMEPITARAHNMAAQLEENGVVAFARADKLTLKEIGSMSGYLEREIAVTRAGQTRYLRLLGEYGGELPLGSGEKLLMHTHPASGQSWGGLGQAAFSAADFTAIGRVRSAVMNEFGWWRTFGGTHEQPIFGPIWPNP